MQSVTEASVTIYRNYTTPLLLPIAEISPLSSGNIFTDAIVLRGPQTRTRVIRCVKHPLNDRDAKLFSANWSGQGLVSLQSVLGEVQKFRMAYWTQQLADHQRFGRREALKREYSSKVIEMATVRQEERRKRRGPARRNTMCAVMYSFHELILWQLRQRESIQ